MRYLYIKNGMPCLKIDGGLTLFSFYFCAASPLPLQLLDAFCRVVWYK